MVKPLGQITIDGETEDIEFVESSTVTTGVEAHVYAFANDISKDLAVVEVKAGHNTPLQKILSGDETIEGYTSGAGSLVVTHADRTTKTYNFPSDDNKQVALGVGDVMQWFADSEQGLVFYEVCKPPYEDGRFEDLGQPNSKVPTTTTQAGAIAPQNKPGPALGK